MPLPSDLNRRVANRLNNPATDCAEFIRKIIDEAARVDKVKAYSNDPIRIFKRIQDECGFRLTVMKNSGEADFTLRGKRVVYINQTYESPDNTRAMNHTQNAYANTALNEVMRHGASGGSVYNDRTLAKALFRIMTPAEQAVNPLPGTSDRTVNFFTGRCPAP